MDKEEELKRLKKILESIRGKTGDDSLFNINNPSDGPYIINNPDLSGYRTNPHQHDINMDFFNGTFGPHAFDPGRSRYGDPREASGTSFHPGAPFGSYSYFHPPFTHDIFEDMGMGSIVGEKIYCRNAYTGSKGDVADVVLIIPFGYQTKSRINK